MKSLLILLPFLLLAGCSRATPTPQFASFADFNSVSAAASPTPSCGTECQALRQEFRYVVYVGKQIYCYWDEKKSDTQLDFNALADRLEQSLTDKSTPTDYYSTLRTWASSFHDGHVNVLPGLDTSELEIYSAPLRLEILAPATDHEKVIVASLIDTDLAAVGDEVLEINGLPVSRALDQAESSVSGSTRRMRRFFASRRLIDVLGIDAGSAPLTLRLRRGQQDFEVSLQRTAELTAKPASSTSAPEDTGTSNFKATVLPGGVGYLRIDAFSGSQDAYLLGQAMDRLSKTRGLVLDLRKNGGGDQSGDAVLSWLASHPIVRYRTSSRMNDFILNSRPENFLLKWDPSQAFSEWMDLPVSANPADRSYAGKPVAALIGPNCFSACDTFASALKTNGLATMVGEATGGGTGTPLVFALPASGHQFRYAVVRGHTSKDAPIEGIGTTPDILIEPTLADRVARTDIQLEKAIAVALGDSAGSLSGAAQPGPAALAKITNSLMGDIWEQNPDVSPTRAQEQDLRKIAPRDELN